MLSSPYVRAWQTAELLRDEAGWPEPSRCTALATGSTADALAALNGHAGLDSVALVGHEPNLSSLASLLVAGDDDALSLELKKGAVALLAIAGRAAPGTALLRWSVGPKILRGLAAE